MRTQNRQPALPWLEPGDAFPPVGQAWGADSEAPGLLAAGGALDVPSLYQAYRQGIFPWFSEGQPILWWSPDPRMVLLPADFRLHQSLRKTLRRLQRNNDTHEIRIDTAFARVMQACATTLRAVGGAGGAGGTWILPQMQRAYVALHQAGFAHSIETWIDGELAGGLYCVAIGKSVFGESMFSHRTDGSKIALAALTCFCRAHGIGLIDCQQNTRHLASLGACEMSRADFLGRSISGLDAQPPRWQFEPLYWQELLTDKPTIK